MMEEADTAPGKAMTGFENIVVPGFKIKGVPGSAAEKYAKDNGIEFESL